MRYSYIRRHIVSISVTLFLLTYAAVLLFEPGFLYNHDGSLRQFGLNNNRKTVVPAWLLAILVAIVSYFAVLYYITLPKFQF